MKLEEFIGEGYKAPNKIYAGRLSVTFNDATNKEVEMFKELETISFGAETGVGITIEAIGCTNSGGYEKDPLEKLGFVRKERLLYEKCGLAGGYRAISFCKPSTWEDSFMIVGKNGYGRRATLAEAKAIVELLESPEYYDLI